MDIEGDRINISGEVLNGEENEEEDVGTDEEDKNKSDEGD